ncbi:MAG: bifunctional folylpolyglutamate synthase/dihydrofolate synthase [Blautia sp.]|nr:bifunctional folylpolyglutamate synthase/dihydrofolate synthase [Blautia sp.]MDY5032161.1 folylpolyglutamate synthase/dihydrofolate synthase family protein [Blautia sp.]
MNYVQSRKYIEDAQQYAGELGLDQMYAMMERLGNPQDRLKVVHVAGTNGKGSVIAYMYTVLQQAGYRVGRYISPTLYSYLERLEINGTPASEEEFAAAVTRVQEAVEKMTAEGLPHPTPFELETAAAFLFFAEKSCDLVFLEVGLGGDMDATNVISAPVLCVLTSISMDHMDYLGNTLGEIAQKKAGIIKKGSLVVTCRQDPEAESVIRDRCEEQEACCVIADAALGKITEESFDGQSFRYQNENYHVALAGACQLENAVLALTALELLGKKGFPTSLSQRREGLSKTCWNGRFTVLCRKPLLIVDGAHNPAAADKLAESIERYFAGKRILYIMGVFRDKDYDYVIRRTCSYAEKIWTIRTPDNPRALPEQELAQAVRKYHRNVQPAQSIPEALEQALKEAGEEDVIIAFGSLSFIGALTEAAEEKKRKAEKNVK